MKLRERIIRWSKPAQWRDDHPLDADERVGEKTRNRHWWEQNQEVGGANWGRLHTEDDFKRPGR
jgi:hypothetical protein